MAASTRRPAPCATSCRTTSCRSWPSPSWSRPTSTDADRIRDEKVKLLQAIDIPTPDEAVDKSVRGQYTAGTIDGEPVVGYRQEEDVAPDSQTETYLALRLRVENWRWAGVPIYVRTGKRLPARVTEVALTFRQVPFLLSTTGRAATCARTP